MKKNMILKTPKFYYILSFILGMIVYNFIPKDVNIEVPDNAPRVTSNSRVISIDKRCSIYEKYLLVDRTVIHGSQEVVCPK